MNKPRIGLQLKIVLGLLIVATVPLGVSALLIGEIGRVAQNFASNEAARLRPHLVRAQQVYRDLVAAKKAVYAADSADLAARPDLLAAAGPPADPAALNAALDALLAADPELVRVAVRGLDGGRLAERSRRAPGGSHELPFEQPLPGGAVLELGFLGDPALMEDYAALGKVLHDSEEVAQFRESLPESYRVAFLLVVGLVVLAVTTAGILMARRLTSRIAKLVAGTRVVAGGDLSARVALAGRDELAELAGSFNKMVADLRNDREQIVYLQKIGAWQDVARRLAHEIKNPLTPIQLAVQQLASSYRDDDPRFQKLLAEASEIVGEEIDNLRRLVDAFSSLGRLPRVEPRPLDLAEVVADLGKDPLLADRLTARPPTGEPVMVQGDRLLLRRLLANLVENGVHAGQEAGRPGGVVLSWRRDAAGGHAVIAIDDEGAGVPAGDRERIFEPYVTSKEHGTGLGLAIAKKIALDHRGALEVAAAPAPTGGARLLLSIPLADEEAAAAGGEGKPIG